jgi:hypothetical protein
MLLRRAGKYIDSHPSDSSMRIRGTLRSAICIEKATRDILPFDFTSRGLSIPSQFFFDRTRDHHVKRFSSALHIARQR